MIIFTEEFLYACKDENIDKIKKAIDSGFDVNQKTTSTTKFPKGTAGLLVAAQWNRVDVIKLLLKHGANIEIENTEKTTPLMGSVIEGNFSAMVELISQGANINCEDKFKNNLLHWATKQMTLDVGVRLNILKYLVDKKKININKGNNLGESPLTNIIKKGHLSIVTYLIQNGADVNQEPNKEAEYNPLKWACLEGHLDIVKELVKYGADVNHLDKWGDSALRVACRQNRVDVIKFLILCGAKITPSVLEVIKDKRELKKLVLIHAVDDNEVVEI